jgi:hypothetical protein
LRNFVSNTLFTPTNPSSIHYTPYHIMSSSSKRKNEKSEEENKPPKLKRIGTMDEAAMEGAAFLEKQAPNLSKHIEQKGVETRAKIQMRDAIDTLMAEKKGAPEEMLASEEKKIRSQFAMVFRLFDKDKDGYINQDELVDAMRSIGKRPSKAKTDKILNDVGKSTDSAISLKEFVDYMVKKRFKKVSKKKVKTPEKPKEKQSKGTPKKSEKQEKKKDAKGKDQEKETGKGKGKGKGKEKEEKEEKGNIRGNRKVKKSRKMKRSRREKRQKGRAKGKKRKLTKKRHHKLNRQEFPCLREGLVLLIFTLNMLAHTTKSMKWL